VVRLVKFEDSGGTCSQRYDRWCVHIMHVLIVPIKCGTWTYTGEIFSVVACQLEQCVFVCGKVNISVCQVVFMVGLVAQ
jgi:hypothetical protein